MNVGTSNGYYGYGYQSSNFNGDANDQQYEYDTVNEDYNGESSTVIDFAAAFNHDDSVRNDKEFVNDEDLEEAFGAERPYKCHVAGCDRSFSRKFDLKRHALVHNPSLEYEDKPFLCPEEGCGKRFLRNHDLNKHKKLHNGEKPFKCPICEKAFARNDNLQSHIRTHADAKLRQSTSGLHGGKETAHHTPILIPLNELEPAMTESDTSEIPLEDVMHGPYVCDAKDCGMQFERRTDFVLHCKSHIYRRVFQCEICSHVFSKSANLTAHMRVHTGERPFHCTCCGLMFARKADRDRHYNRQHLPSDTFKCTEEECHATFARKPDLNRHMKRHLKEEQEAPPPVETHEETSVSPPPHTCSKCPEVFKTRTELRAHRKIHGETEYCGCGEKFESRAELKEHSKSHVAEERLKCLECSHIFSKPANLKAHMRIHTGEKPYKCDGCGLRFNRKSVMENHRRRKHPENPQDGLEEFDEDVPGTSGMEMKSPKLEHVANCDLNHELNHDPKREPPSVEMSSFTCELCGEIFGTQKEHSEHIEEHNQPPPVQKTKLLLVCKVCRETFESRPGLRSHLKRVHSIEMARNEIPAKKRVKVEEEGDMDDPKNMFCILCGRMFTTKADRKQHMRKAHPNVDNIPSSSNPPSYNDGEKSDLDLLNLIF